MSSLAIPVSPNASEDAGNPVWASSSVASLDHMFSGPMTLIHVLDRSHGYISHQLDRPHAEHIREPSATATHALALTQHRFAPNHPSIQPHKSERRPHHPADGSADRPFTSLSAARTAARAAVHNLQETRHADAERSIDEEVSFS